MKTTPCIIPKTRTPSSVVWVTYLEHPDQQQRPGDRLGDRDPAEEREGGHERTAAASEVKNPRPSVPDPVRSSTECSGCGIRPTTLPRSLVMPAMSRAEPLGLTSR